jgi:hypothetical protein
VALFGAVTAEAGKLALEREADFAIELAAHNGRFGYWENHVGVHTPRQGAPTASFNLAASDFGKHASLGVLFTDGHEPQDAISPADNTKALPSARSLLHAVTDTAEQYEAPAQEDWQLRDNGLVRAEELVHVDTKSVLPIAAELLQIFGTAVKTGAECGALFEAQMRAKFHTAGELRRQRTWHGTNKLSFRTQRPQDGRRASFSVTLVPAYDKRDTEQMTRLRCSLTVGPNYAANAMRRYTLKQRGTEVRLVESEHRIHDENHIGTLPATSKTITSLARTAVNYML